MNRRLMSGALCLSAMALLLNSMAEDAAAQGAAIAKSKGWMMQASLTPAALQAAGNKPVMLVFR
jgi:hypothetical protein